MRISYPQFFRRANSAYALIITLLFLAVSLVSLGSVLWWASSNAKVTQQNELFTSAEGAAEAATEQVVATLDRDWSYGQNLAAPSVYQQMYPIQSNWIMHFQISDGSNHVGQTGFSTNIIGFVSNLGSSFAGLAGYETDCSIVSTATTTGQLYTVSATVQQVVQADIIPLFQFAVFYNLNLEIDPGAAMIMNGAVFSNQGIWAGTANITFNSTVAAAGLVYDRVTDTTNDNPWCSGKTDTGTPAANFLYPSQPENHQDTLTLPVGTNNNPSAVESILAPPSGTNAAPNPGAYTTNNQIYLFNECDLIVSNSANGLASAMGTNITIWFQDPNNVNPWTQISNDVYVLKTGGLTNVVVTNRSAKTDCTTNVLYASFSFVTNVQFYDFRETDTNQAVQIDVSKLNIWLTNRASTGGNQYNSESFLDKGHGINSIYVYNSVSRTSNQLPSVRLINGAQLPFTTDPNGTGRTTGGLTVATPQPLYVEGNYNVQTASSSAGAAANTTNTTYTYPAAIMGDAVTILSSAWQDGGANYLPGGTMSSRNPSTTTINAACLEGIVQSTNSTYSGGLENFLRLEENWNSTVTLTYNGSIVVMFPSQYATGSWAYGGYYTAPTRHWGFDVNFTVPSKLPPLTPKSYKILRHSFLVY